GRSFTITCSIGVGRFPEHGGELEPLLQAADTAMYEAKRQGGRRCLFYDSSYHTQLTNILLIKQELPQAMEAGQIYLAYQPQFSLHNGSLTGCEALIRWKHPLQGHVSPAQFIPVAESDGFIIKLGEWILQQACRQKQLWHEAGIGDAWRMGINLSLMQLIHEGENGLFAHTLEKVLEATGIQPHEIELELTETLFAHQDHPLLQANLQHLRQMGVSLAIDDFGTGHSSLGRLKFFPIDTIKVDRVFVRDLTQDSNDEAIVRAIVALGHTLDMRILAEGVETTRAVIRVARKRGIEMPIAEVVHDVLLGKISAREGLDRLIHRPPKSEEVPG
ncbi:MAG: EAL domain-containing protein, partial [Candidatus Hydrothermae bacterium]|nr:EAL domain-containing protein [Candidatus Hydrothermae bacterium]